MGDLVLFTAPKVVASNGSVNIVVQQWDPLDPLLFALVLHCTILKIFADPQCKEMLLNCWYLDDGALAGPRDAVSRALKFYGCLDSNIVMYHCLVQCHGTLRYDKLLKIALPLHMQLLMPVSSYQNQDLNAGNLSR